jgi:hypothetical protein
MDIKPKLIQAKTRRYCKLLFMKTIISIIMKTNLYKIASVLLVFMLSYAVSAQFNLLYVGKSDNTLDIATSEYFTLEGYNVTFVEEADFKVEGGTYSTAGGYAGFNVLFVSESIGSSSANNYKAAGFPIPAVATEGFVAKISRWGLLNDESETYFKQASSADLTADALTLVISDNSNWITQEFAPGDYLVWAETADPTKVGVTAFNLAEDISGALPLGSFLFDMGMPSVWAIPKGSVLHSTTELPNIVIIGIIQTDVGQTFTGDFLEFMVRCVRWATDDYPVEGMNTPGLYDLEIGPNPTRGMVHVSLNLPEAGNVTVNIYDITGRLVESTNPGYLNAGHNFIQFDLSGMVGAQYIYEIITGNDVLKGKIIRE